MAYAVVSFVGQLNRYNTLVLTDVEPKQVAKTLDKMGFAHADGMKLRASELATQFLRLHPTAVLTERSVSNPGEYTYTINVPDLRVTVQDGKRAVVFNGSISKFLQWDSNQDEFTHLQKALAGGKEPVVRFTYKGGSNVGKERLVKLTGVVRAGKETLLKGWDVVQSNEAKRAYRSYRVANIVGKVEVLG